ncbi:MAG: hypothetical protein ACLTSL_12090 [Odoribacter splanchnicus]
MKLVKGPSYEGDLPDNATVYIHSVVPTATIDFTTGVVVKDLFGEMTTIKTRKVDNATYEAISCSATVGFPATFYRSSGERYFLLIGGYIQFQSRKTTHTFAYN